MFRPARALIALSLAACTQAPLDDTTDSIAQALDASPAGIGVTDITRERVVGDVFHESFMLRLGDTPNAQIRLHRIVRERAPWLPRPTRAGVMLLHGDFSSFTTNFFESGMATWLAQHGIDVWGVDRRWAVTPTDGDLSDFGSMTFAQEIDDTERALAAARTVRIVTGSGSDRVHLSGFSRGGFLAYAVAASEGARRPSQRHVKGLIPLDVWAEVPPEDTAARAWLCEGAAFERDLLAQGVTDSENSFLIELGQLTNRPLFLMVAAQTYNGFTVTPHYHLAAADIVDGEPVALTESPEAAIAQWFAHATPHQSMAEAADSDGLWCGDGQAGPAIDLAAIRVPLFYIGAAGGFGDRGIYSTTRVSSTDVTTTVITHTQDPFEDFGHGDLLFGYDAPALVWQPLASWLAAH
jgi:hypothetical protein